MEDRIVAELGGVYGPYTGRWFANKRETDIEHIVARSEAHDSGLCAADEATRRRFAMDLLNLTLASPGVNRNQKRARDAAEWLPDQNRCWFADRSLAVRRKYGLTIDQREADALESVLSGCQSTELVVVARGASPAAQDITPTAADARETLVEWDDNDDGRITCAEARAHGIAPVRRNHPAYPYMRDGDGDGIVCEAGGSETQGRHCAPRASICGTQQQGAPSIRRKRQRAYHVRRGPRAWDCPGAPRPSRVPLHAGCRRGRGGLRAMNGAAKVWMPNTVSNHQ